MDLGEHVLRSACRQAARWRDQGISIGMGVNLSTRQLTDAGLVDRVAAIMMETSTPPGALWLEVTETALVEDLAMAAETLQQLECLGAQIAIDDFGTGWASLTYLHQFPIHALKVDRVFVAGLGERASDAAIVRSIVSLSSELGLETVAEGIETQEQLDQLRALGCKLGQGYLFARPEPADRVSLGHSARGDRSLQVSA